jgi:alpha-L-fucosidase
MFANNLASGAKVGAEVVDGQSAGEVNTLLDGNPDTFWTTTETPTEVTITVELPTAVRANCLMLQEHIASGQRVESFDAEVLADGQWRAIAKGTVIGHKRLVRFPDNTISQLRIRFTQFRMRPTLAEMGLYLAPAILSPPMIVRDLDGNVTIKAPEGSCARYTLDGSTPTKKSQLYTTPISMPTGGDISVRTFPLTPASENIAVESSTARTQFGLAKAKWKIVECDSQDDVEGDAQRAIDDDASTFWHSRYRDSIDPMPHHLTVDLGESIAIRGFTYTPRQDQWDGGIIMQAKFEVSQDGKEWRVVADDVKFDNIVNSRQLQVVNLPNSVTARYIRLTALRTANDNNLASAADISVLVE